MENTLQIYDNLKERFININPEDTDFEDMEKTRYFHHGKPGKARKFYSKTRLDQHNQHFIFAYEYLFSDRVEIALNTGINPAFTIEDPKHLIEKPTDILKRWPEFYGIIIVRPEDLDKKLYSYEDIVYLIAQSYEMLNLHKSK